ncbi:MAG: putative NAD/FAD-binding protein [Gammaproteobacteria bacterium]|jgi:predicted NAD/FAD-binding protein
MNIAIIGAGISGLTAAHYLNSGHTITLYEMAEKIGGHTATVDVEYGGDQYAIDTGFIVFNDWTYPSFIELLDELKVESQATEMSFSVRSDATGLEYGGNNLNTLFAQRKNILRPSFYKMIKDILRFNREAVSDLEGHAISPSTTLGEYLQANNYGEGFIYQYLVPMGCAIWSASTQSMLDFPLVFFIRFFKNHGLLSVNDRPQWRVIKGGSRSYLKPLIDNFGGSLVVNSKISEVGRDNGLVHLTMSNGNVETFDHLVFACHSDQALALLGDVSQAEKIALTCIPYRENEVVLHADTRILPANKLTWSSWNYWVKDRIQERPILTYNMNILQQLNSDKTFCVSLNATKYIDPEKIIERFNYSHPVFSLEGISSAASIQKFNGTDNTWYAGAYLGNGFHEDGVVSGRRVAEAINAFGLDTPKKCPASE